MKLETKGQWGGALIPVLIFLGVVAIAAAVILSKRTPPPPPPAPIRVSEGPIIGQWVKTPPDPLTKAEWAEYVLTQWVEWSDGKKGFEPVDGRNVSFSLKEGYALFTKTGGQRQTQATDQNGVAAVSIYAEKDGDEELNASFGAVAAPVIRFNVDKP